MKTFHEKRYEIKILQLLEKELNKIWDFFKKIMTIKCLNKKVIYGCKVIKIKVNILLK